MVDVIEACVSNVESTDKHALSEVGVTTRVYPCLERCGRCYRAPFLVVDGELRTGESHADLLDTIRDR